MPTVPLIARRRVPASKRGSPVRNGLIVHLNPEKDYYDIVKDYEGFPLIPNVAALELHDDALTIAEALKLLGYSSAHVGKWRMRGNRGKEGDIVHDGPTTNNEGNTMSADLSDGQPKPKHLPKDLEDPKLMFSVTKKGMGFMEDQVKKGNPFYLQLSHYAMHSGREYLDTTREKYLKHPLVQKWYRDHKQDPDAIGRKSCPANWLAMVEDLDGRIGAVLDKAKGLGIYDNTYFIVVSDNGYRHDELLLKEGLTQPLHSRKWWLWQGGI